MFSLLQISGRGWYEGGGGGGGGNRILTRTVCSLLSTSYQLSVLSGIYQCLVRKQSVFLQFGFLNFSKWVKFPISVPLSSLSSLAANMKGFTKYFQGQVKPSKNPQYVLGRTLILAAAVVATVCISILYFITFFWVCAIRCDREERPDRMNGDTKPLLLCGAVRGDIISVRIIVIVLLSPHHCHQSS